MNALLSRVPNYTIKLIMPEVATMPRTMMVEPSVVETQEEDARGSGYA